MNRGGSWNNNATNCRVANRNNNSPSNTNNNLGFRLALQLVHAAAWKNREQSLSAQSFMVLWQIPQSCTAQQCPSVGSSHSPKGGIAIERSRIFQYTPCTWWKCALHFIICEAHFEKCEAHFFVDLLDD